MAKGLISVNICYHAPMANKYAKAKPAPTLDLHGYKTEDVFDAVERFLLQHTNQPRLRIMPGKGTGKVKAQVEEYLRLARYHWNFEKLDNGKMNEGVMIVFME